MKAMLTGFAAIALIAIGFASLPVGYYLFQKTP